MASSASRLDANLTRLPQSHILILEEGGNFASRLSSENYDKEKPNFFVRVSYAEVLPPNTVCLKTINDIIYPGN
jgi:hypothetical protein